METIRINICTFYRIIFWAMVRADSKIPQSIKSPINSIGTLAYYFDPLDKWRLISETWLVAAEYCHKKYQCITTQRISSETGWLFKNNTKWNYPRYKFYFVSTKGVLTHGLLNRRPPCQISALASIEAEIWHGGRRLVHLLRSPWVSTPFTETK